MASRTQTDWLQVAVLVEASVTVQVTVVHEPTFTTVPKVGKLVAYVKLGEHKSVALGRCAAGKANIKALVSVCEQAVAGASTVIGLGQLVITGGTPSRTSTVKVQVLVLAGLAASVKMYLIVLIPTGNMALRLAAVPVTVIGFKVAEVAVGPLTILIGPVQSLMAPTEGSAQPVGWGRVHTEGDPIVNTWLAGHWAAGMAGPLTSRACTVMEQVRVLPAASVAIKVLVNVPGIPVPVLRSTVMLTGTVVAVPDKAQLSVTFRVRV